MEQKTEIIVQGLLDQNWKNWHADMDVNYIEGNTVIRVSNKDQTFIHGILNLIRDLNLKLISVNPVNHQTSN